MSARANSNSSENENMCVVCFKNTDIYSVGLCDHPVCYECSTRMRVLCRQNECPICRQDMPKVIFTYKVQPYRVMKQQLDHATFIDRKFGVWFTTKDIRDAYYSLLEHNCSKCTRREAFKTFLQLKEHMRRDHELNYCDLCVENIRIFTWERRCYNRSELAQHRRKGDPDDTSHRGHPLCQFCDTRYMDSDELFRHLRRDHEFCHFCDADGFHHYYPSYDYLRDHFQKEHFLCEEGECIHEKFTSVFRSEIDLKAHRASVHGKFLGKAASKQARTLDFEFTLAPRPRPNNVRPGNKPFREDERLEEEGAVGYEHTIHTEPGGSRGVTLTAQDFPSLGGGNPAAPVPRLQGGGNVTIRHNIRRGKEGLARTNENFPALSGDSSTVRFSVNSSTVIPPEHAPASSAPKVSIHVNHRPNGITSTTHISQNSSSNSSSIRVRPRSDAFPALGSVTVPEEAQWVKLKKEPKEPKLKVHKVAPAPVLPSRDSPTDFPSLSGTKTDQLLKSSKKSSSLTVPVTISWTPQETEVETKDSKTNNKNKKKKGSKSAADGISNASVVNTQNNQNNKSSQSISKTSSASEPSNKTTNNSKKVTQTEKSDKPKQQQQNGFAKKRSELKIDSLHISQPSSSSSNTVSNSTNSMNKEKQQKYTSNGTTNNNEDFPSLTNKPPPGFMMQAPPGFAANDLTFTNSSGQSYSILPTHKFSPPPNFPHRNKMLVESFMASLESNEAILEFKNLSGMFRNGLYTAAQYYQHCNTVMKTDFPKIFPELLVLLPDIEKQQALFAIHCKTPANRKGLEVCATCAQILSSSDLRSHLATHTLENQFPALGTHEMSSVWRK